MKAYFKRGIIITIAAAIATLATSPAWDHYHFGWSEDGEYHSSLKLQQKRVAFIRSHQCRLVMRIAPSQEWDADLDLKMFSGYTFYNCDNVHDSIDIHDFELQP